MELKHCKICNQMTNHGCLKCKPKKVWIVGSADAESTTLEYVCATKETAIKKYIEVVNDLIKQYKEAIKMCSKFFRGEEACMIKEYRKMIKGLEKELKKGVPTGIDFYPYETPYIKEKECI